MKRQQIASAALVILLGAGAAYAHHSFAAIYDLTKTITVTGTVTGVEWLNPHAHFFVDVENEQGGLDNWDFELASPNGLLRLGWKRDSLKVGDVVTVDGIPARNGSRSANTRSVTTADERKLFTGDPVQGGL